MQRAHPAAGYAAAGVQTLFLEQYLDQPIERAMAEGARIASREFWES